MGRLRGAGQRSSPSSGASKVTAGGGVASGYGDADVAKLKEAIQTLCQSTHPLGEWFPRRKGDDCWVCMLLSKNELGCTGNARVTPLYPSETPLRC